MRMLSCKEIFEFEYKGKTSSLFLSFQIKLHKLICQKCRSFSRNLDQVGSLLTNSFHRKAPITAAKTKNLEENILKKLRRRK